MKRKYVFICLIICLFISFLCACNNSNNIKQTASAWISEGEIDTLATVNLTEGWSVEFAKSAIYIYDKEIDDFTESIAMCVTLEEDVYNDYIQEAKKSDSYKEINNQIYYHRQNHYI